MTPPVVLTVAGTDSGGAAGIAADLTTFAALGAHGACVVTAVTAQDTTGVHAVHPVPIEVVAAQIDAVLDDLPVAAVKTGMLGSAEVVALVATRLAGERARPLVVDPVLVATSGAVLGDASVVGAYRAHLLPVATVVTPNTDEAQALLGWSESRCEGHDGAREMAVALARLGPAVVVTGGVEMSGSEGTHRPARRAVAGSSAGAATRGRPTMVPTCTDWLATPNGHVLAHSHAAVETSNDHGTGCTFSAAAAAHLAHGLPLERAVAEAAEFTRSQLAQGKAWHLGRGRGPVAHTFRARPVGTGDTPRPVNDVAHAGGLDHTAPQARTPSAHTAPIERNLA